jgi:hypothetical protein
MGIAAAICYGLAYLHYSQGALHHEAYVDAYVACGADSSMQALAAESCRTSKTVAEHFNAYDEAYASGAPFLSFGFSLTVALILSPLTHRSSLWMENRIAEVAPGKPAPGLS